jgi:hypothetical protein
MDHTGKLFFGQNRELLERLGDDEPSTTDEADALIESIRISKGYLDEDIKSDLQKLDARTRDVMLQFVARQREIEAAFTKRSEPASFIITFLTHAAFPGSCIRPSIASCLSSSKMLMIHSNGKPP